MVARFVNAVVDQLARQVQLDSLGYGGAEALLELLEIVVMRRRRRMGQRFGLWWTQTVEHLAESTPLSLRCTDTLGLEYECKLTILELQRVVLLLYRELAGMNVENPLVKKEWMKVVIAMLRLCRARGTGYSDVPGLRIDNPFEADLTLEFTVRMAFAKDILELLAGATFSPRGELAFDPAMWTLAEREKPIPGWATDDDSFCFISPKDWKPVDQNVSIMMKSEEGIMHLCRKDHPAFDMWCVCTFVVEGELRRAMFLWQAKRLEDEEHRVPSLEEMFLAGDEMALACPGIQIFIVVALFGAPQRIVEGVERYTQEKAFSGREVGEGVFVPIVIWWPKGMEEFFWGVENHYSWAWHKMVGGFSGGN
jgi:hypothetical protein